MKHPNTIESGLNPKRETSENNIVKTIFFILFNSPVISKIIKKHENEEDANNTKYLNF